MNTNQRALLRVARTCTKEADRADRLGHHRYAREIRGAARRALAQAAAEGSDPLVKAIGCVKNACELAADLPDRDTDSDGHDALLKTMHGHVQSARSYLQEHLNPAGLPLPKSRRRRGSGSGTEPSSTDSDKPYESATGHVDLLRGLDSLHKAEDEADRLADLLDDDEGERDKSAADLHFHVKSADESFQAYRDSVVNNPEQEKRRTIARAFARTIAVGLH